MADAIAGAVLVGGASRRMGRDKAVIHIDGQPMVDRIGAVLRAAGCVPVFAVGPGPLAGALAHFDDLFPGQGPLGGVLTALACTSPPSTAVCVVACDMPWLDAESVAQLLDVARVTTANVAMAQTDRLEPLCAVWNVSSAPALQRAFDSGERAIHLALGQLVTQHVALPALALRNVNTPSDLPSR